MSALSPSVFGRPCAHALALARQEAHQAAQSGDRARALALFDELCAASPGARTRPPRAMRIGNHCYVWLRKPK